jgi:ADP-heptose:LPS heptosyltransferase
MTLKPGVLELAVVLRPPFEQLRKQSSWFGSDDYSSLGIKRLKTNENWPFLQSQQSLIGPCTMSNLRRMLITVFLNPKFQSSGKRRNFEIGIYKHDRIGDLILASGAIRTIIAAYSVQRCVLIVSPVVRELAAEMFPGLEIISLQGPLRFGRVHDWLTFMLPWWIIKGSRSLKRLKVDKLICLRHHPDIFHDCALSAIAAGQSFGIGPCAGPRAINMGQVYYRFNAFAEYPAFDETAFPLELEAHRRVVSLALGKSIAIEDVIPKLESTIAVQHFLLVSPYGNSVIRTYPLESLIRTLREVRNSSDLPIVVCAAPNDANRIRDLEGALKSAGISGVSVSLPAGVKAFVDLVKSARAVLTVETATAHLATALNKPTVVLMGGGHYGEFGPWSRSELQTWVTHKLPCFGCDWKCIFTETRCMTEIDPRSVASALLAAMVHDDGVHA